MKNLSWPTQISKKSQLFHFLVKKNLSWPTQNPPQFSQKSQLATSLTEEAHGPAEQSNDHLEIVNDYLRQHNKTFVFMGGGDDVGVLVR